MTPEDQERMNQLCTAIQQETDAKRLIDLTDELNALLLQKDGKGSSSPPNVMTQSSGWTRKKLPLMELMRCPYCVEADGCKIMAKQEEMFICMGCGHAVIPSQPGHKCDCRNCKELDRSEQS